MAALLRQRGFGRGRICLASFNSPTPKTPC